jgi:peptidoglycan/xylan/chitin deacetylase (PgdA/CDA1 family)
MAERQGTGLVCWQTPFRALPVVSVRRRTQLAVRAVHAALPVLRGALPDQLALYFHSLGSEDWHSFSRLIEFLCQELDYQVTDPLGFVAFSSHRRLFISFDDNYRSWYEARRVFDRLNTRVTFYVNTLPFECPEGSRELEDYYRRLRHSGPAMPLTREALRELWADGHTIGAHTHSHPVLTALPEGQAQREIARSKELLEAILGDPVIHFSYPYGMRRHFNESLRRSCLAQGFVTIANAIPAMLYARQQPERIQRSFWRFDQSFEHNLTNIQIDGRWFERVTGRSAVV